MVAMIDNLTSVDVNGYQRNSCAKWYSAPIHATKKV